MMITNDEYTLKEVIRILTESNRLIANLPLEKVYDKTESYLSIFGNMTDAIRMLEEYIMETHNEIGFVSAYPTEDDSLATIKLKPNTTLLLGTKVYLQPTIKTSIEIKRFKIGRLNISIRKSKKLFKCGDMALTHGAFIIFNRFITYLVVNKHG